MIPAAISRLLLSDSRLHSYAIIISNYIKNSNTKIVIARLQVFKCFKIFL